MIATKIPHLANYPVSDTNEIEGTHAFAIKKPADSATDSARIHKDKEDLYTLLHSLEVARGRLLAAQARLPVSSSRAAQLQNQLTTLELFIDKLQHCPEQGGNGFKALLGLLMAQLLQDEIQDHHGDGHHHGQKPPADANARPILPPEEVHQVVLQGARLQDDMEVVRKHVEDVFLASMLVRAIRLSPEDAERVKEKIAQQIDYEMKAELAHMPEEHDMPAVSGQPRRRIRADLKTAIITEYTHRHNAIDVMAHEMQSGKLSLHEVMDLYVGKAVEKLHTDAEHLHQMHPDALSQQVMDDMQHLVLRVRHIEGHLQELEHAHHHDDPLVQQVEQDVHDINNCCACTENDIGRNLEKLVRDNIRGFCKAHGVDPEQQQGQFHSHPHT